MDLLNQTRPSNRRWHEHVYSRKRSNDRIELNAELVITVDTRGIKSQVHDHTLINSNEQETQVVFLAKKKRSFWITLPSLHKPMYMQN
jgi:hypothetical protein